MKTTVFLCSLLMSIGLLQAQTQEKAARFTVEVSTDSLLMGNLLKVTFTLENAKGDGFEAPYFTGFDLQSGPNYSSSVSIVNGRSTQRLSYTYYLMPKDVGNYYIEPASVLVDGQVLETMPVEVIVVPNPDGHIQQPSPEQRLGQSFHFEMPGFEGSPFGEGGFEGFPGFDWGDFPRFNWEGLDQLQEFFLRPEQLEQPKPGEEQPQPKKKRKTYKL